MSDYLKLVNEFIMESRSSNEKKFTEFKLEKFKIWHKDEVPENISEIRDFFSRGYDKLLLAEAEKKGEAYVEPINNLIHDYKIMLQNPSKYGL